MHSFIAKTNGVEPDNNSEVEKCVQNLVMRYLLPYKNNGWQKIRPTSRIQELLKFYK